MGLRLLRPLPRIRILVTMADARATLTAQALAMYRDAGFEVCRTVIRSGVIVSKSTWPRKPLYEYAPESKPAKDYEALAKEVQIDG